MRPLQLTHVRSKATDDKAALCRMCATALHMSKGEASLLLYYAAQQSGFKPAVKTIEDATGVSRRRIFTARQQLVDRGLALIQQGRLYLDWERIRLFSTLDPALTGKYCIVAPVILDAEPPKKRRFPPALFFQAAPIEDVAAFFESLSAKEFDSFRRQHNKHDTS